MNHEYDPQTCIMASELRAIGFPVDAAVPDWGWTYRDSIEWKLDGTHVLGDELVTNLAVTFHQPFHWLTFDVIIGKPENPATTPE